jgi:hypothetical protein
VLKSEDFRTLAGPQKAAIFMLSVTGPFRLEFCRFPCFSRDGGVKGGVKRPMDRTYPDGATKLAGTDPWSQCSV